MDVEACISIFLNPLEEMGLRDDIAMALGEEDSKKAYEALLAYGQKPDDMCLVDTAAESLALIWKCNQDFNDQDFKKLHPMTQSYLRFYLSLDLPIDIEKCGKVLFDQSEPADMREHAALELGGSDQDLALEILIRYAQKPDGKPLAKKVARALSMIWKRQGDFSERIYKTLDPLSKNYIALFFSRKN